MEHNTGEKLPSPSYKNDNKKHVIPSPDNNNNINPKVNKGNSINSHHNEALVQHKGYDINSNFFDYSNNANNNSDKNNIIKEESGNPLAYDNVESYDYPNHQISNNKHFEANVNYFEHNKMNNEVEDNLQDHQYLDNHNNNDQINNYNTYNDKDNYETKQIDYNNEDYGHQLNQVGLTGEINDESSQHREKHVLNPESGSTENMMEKNVNLNSNTFFFGTKGEVEDYFKQANNTNEVVSNTNKYQKNNPVTSSSNNDNYSIFNSNNPGSNQVFHPSNNSFKDSFTNSNNTNTMKVIFLITLRQ